jgi:hypothetical protein
MNYWMQCHDPDQLLARSETQRWVNLSFSQRAGACPARLSSTLRLGSTELAEVRPEGSSPTSPDRADTARLFKPHRHLDVPCLRGGRQQTEPGDHATIPVSIPVIPAERRTRQSAHPDGPRI